MKYWLLTTEYPPFFGGGISTYCYFTARMLAERGNKVTVFVNDPAVKDFKLLEEQGIRIVRFNPSRTGSAAFLGHVTNISYEFAAIVEHFVEQEGLPDIIEAQEYLGIAYYLLQFKYLQYEWCRSVPVVITIHAPSFLYMEYNQVLRYAYPNYWICEMERFCLQSADMLIAPSQFILDEIHKRFELRNKAVAVLPNPFLTKASTRPADDLVARGQIVFYGKLSAQKGTFKLLQYFKQMWDGGFAEPLYLIGGQDIVYHPEGKTMGDVIRLRYKSYIDTGLLRLEGRIKPSERAGRLSAAQVVIVPSDGDNLPYVVFEAMGMGNVVLASRQGGQAEVIEDGVDGFLFDHNQPETFAAQLKRILALSDAERKTIASNAIRKLAEGYNPGAIYERKIALIKSLQTRREPSRTFPFVRPVLPPPNVHASQHQAEVEGLLSIVVPYFNMGLYIDETIRSIQSANYKRMEIVIVNDGSTDPLSLERLKPYRNAANIRVIDTENQGLAHARNYGAALAQGEFLAFLDADDTVSPDYYPKAITVLQQYSNVYFVGAWTQYFEGSDKKWPTFMPEEPLILYHNLVNSSALVYKRQAFLAAGLNDPDMPFKGLEDYDSVISLTAAGYKGVALPQPLFQYRVRKDSMIRDISSAKKLYLREYISLKHKAFYNRFATEVFNLQSENGPGTELDNPTLDFHLSSYLPFGGQLSTRIISLIKKHKGLKTVAYRIYKMIKSR